jgi:hypothetical protein
MGQTPSASDLAALPQNGAGADAPTESVSISGVQDARRTLARATKPTPEQSRNSVIARSKWDLAILEEEALPAGWEEAG